MSDQLERDLFLAGNVEEALTLGVIDEILN